MFPMFPMFPSRGGDFRKWMAIDGNEAGMASNGNEVGMAINDNEAGICEVGFSMTRVWVLYVVYTMFFVAQVILLQLQFMRVA
jgi:hypothetical protein